MLSHLQVGDQVSTSSQSVSFEECHPQPGRKHSLSDFDYRRNGGQRYATVIATYYTGCGAGRYESPTYRKYADQYAAAATAGAPRAAFLASLKVGVNRFVCSSWATLDGQDSPNLYFIDDASRNLQYLFFTNEHPMYVVLDHCQRVKKFFREGEMRNGLKPLVDQLLAEAKDSSCESGGVNTTEDIPAPPPTTTPEATPKATDAPKATIKEPSCVPQFGKDPSVVSITPQHLPQGKIAPGGQPFVSKPRDLSFNPLTGELWVINNNTESVTVFARLQKAMAAMMQAGEALPQQRSPLNAASHLKALGVTVANRRDRGYYHYMARGASISFDQRGQFATCQESENDYDLHDLPNYFMGPTLYNASTSLLFQADGQPCQHDDMSPNATEPCFLSHIDILHESPVCMGIVHDPESVTPWGNVYWTVATRYEPTAPEYSSDALTLLRYDFEMPHPIGLMDHRLANVRRYHDISVRRRPGVPSHLAVDPYSSTLYIADTGNNRIIAVNRTTGSFARHARQDQGGEFLIWSAQVPAFEYSIYHCLQHNASFATLNAPSGIAIDANFIYVSEHDSGHIVALEKGTGREVGRVDAGEPGIMGLALDPADGSLWFVNGLTDRIGRVYPRTECDVADLPSPDGHSYPVQYPPVKCGEPIVSTLYESVLDHVPHDCRNESTSEICLGEQYGFSRDNCTGPMSYDFDMLPMTGHFF